MREIGLLTCGGDYSGRLPEVRKPPWLHAPNELPFTVAGQWRNLTAFPYISRAGLQNITVQEISLKAHAFSPKRNSMSCFLRTTTVALLCASRIVSAASITTSAECEAGFEPAIASTTSCVLQTPKADSQPWSTYTPASASATATTIYTAESDSLFLQMDLNVSALEGTAFDFDTGVLQPAAASASARASFTITGTTNGPIREGLFRFVMSGAGSLPASATPGHPEHSGSWFSFTGLSGSLGCGDPTQGCVGFGVIPFTLGQSFLLTFTGSAALSTDIDSPGGYGFYTSALRLEFMENDETPVGWRETDAVNTPEPGTYLTFAAGLGMLAAAALRHRIKAR